VAMASSTIRTCITRMGGSGKGESLNLRRCRRPAAP
jgi:hypothetical protein